MTAIDPLVPVGEAADADVHSDLASLRRVWRLAGPLRGKVARGVAFRFLQSICLGLAFGGVIWTVTGLAEGRIAMKLALDILLNRPLKEE